MLVSNTEPKFEVLIDTLAVDEVCTVSVPIVGSSDGSSSAIAQLSTNDSPVTSNAITYTVDGAIPVVTLSGSASQVIPQHTLYFDPGTVVSDNRDTSPVLSVQGSVNTSVPGSYTLTYTATDHVGNVSLPVQRSVTVSPMIILPPPPPPPPPLPLPPVTTYNDPLPGGGTGSLKITGENAACTIANSAFTPAAGLPNGYNDFRGAVSFIANSCGGYVDVVMDFGTPIPANAEIWKSNGSWQQLVSATISGTTVSFRVTDGGPLDADGMVNGQIDDPFAIFVPAATPGTSQPTAVPAVPIWGLLVGALALFGIGRKRLKALS